jgi:NAD(P)-dependent dehydrogenase (short-subunit alcohol dehydrogenase family)
MLERGWGRVVVVASVVAKRGETQVSAYTASKHGVLGLVRAASAELARTGITVNAVCPGWVDTPMTAAAVDAVARRHGISEAEAAALLAKRQPIGRLIRPDEVAAAVHACVENPAINGQGINVDGGAVQS